MKLLISDKRKKEMFVALFQILKGSTNLISMMINDDHIFIQGMDKSHVCLFDIKIMGTWFSHFEVNFGDSKNICFDSSTLHTILNIATDDHSISISYQGDADKLSIDLMSNVKGNFNKFFSVPLTEFDNDIFDIPNTDYDAEFSINAKKMHDITSQMILFGSDIRINCVDDKINLNTDGDLGNMMVSIPIDDLNEYCIAEDETIELLYNLTFLHKMCLSTKLSNDINVSISKDCPMKIKYDLGENSQFLFYLAPKLD
jgi:proliferating cell nuclear antigen PCNA